MTVPAFPAPTPINITVPAKKTASPLVRIFDINNAEDLYRLENADLSLHDVQLSSGVCFPALPDSISPSLLEIFILNLRLHAPSETFTNDLALWLREHRRFCFVVLWPSSLSAELPVAKYAMVLRQRPGLAEDLTAFFENFLNPSNLLRCDQANLNLITQGRGCWQLLSYSDTSTLTPEKLSAAGRSLSAAAAPLPSTPKWLMSFRASAEALKGNPVGALLRPLTTTHPQTIFTCSVGKTTAAGFHAAVLSQTA